VLGKLLSDGLADLFVGHADQPVRGREAAEVRDGLKVPDDDATDHGLKAGTERALGRLDGPGDGASAFGSCGHAARLGSGPRWALSGHGRANPKTATLDASSFEPILFCQLFARGAGHEILASYF
jgi:hypothetical protein